MASQNAVVLSTSPYQGGGTERMVQVLASTLVRQGIGVRFFIPNTPRDPSLVSGSAQWHREHGAPAEINAAFSRDTQGWRNVRALTGLLRGCAGRVVNLHYAETTSVSLTDVLAARLAGKRCVLTIQHPTPWRVTSARNQKVIALALRLAHRVVVSTNFTRDLVSERLPDRSRIAVIPCGIPPPAQMWKKDAARQTLGLPPDAFVVGSLGRLEAYKGTDDTLRALARLFDPQGRLRFLVAGDGPARTELEKLAAEILPGRAQFLGKVADAAIVYAASDIFALPSHLEGFGLVYVEAAFAGLPSIGCAAGGAPFVIADGETGLLVPPADPPALAAAIERLWENMPLRQTMGNAAQARAAAEFTDTVMTDRYRAILFD